MDLIREVLPEGSVAISSPTLTVPEVTVDPEQALATKQTSAQLHGALARLEPQFREVVVLFDLQGFAYREIAEICGVPMGTVKSRLRRGRDGLRRLLVADGVIGRRRAQSDRSDWRK